MKGKKTKHKRERSLDAPAPLLPRHCRYSSNRLAAMTIIPKTAP